MPPRSRTAPPPALTVALGPETFLAERVVEDVLNRAQKADPTVEVIRVEAAQTTPAGWDEIAGPSLFGGPRVVVLTGLPDAEEGLLARLSEQAGAPEPDVVVVTTHPGGAKHRKWLEGLRGTGAVVVACDRLVREDELIEFVGAQARRARGRVPDEAAALLVQALGPDLRSLAAAVEQLLSDGAGEATPELVAQFFEGRAEVKGWTVADRAVAGDASGAMRELRWALTTGTAPVLIVGAVAGQLRTLAQLHDLPVGVRNQDAARSLGLPAWKVGQQRAAAAAWRPSSLAAAMRAVAAADLRVKGGSNDPALALSLLVLELAELRRRQ